MTVEHLVLLENSIDRTLEFEMLDGTRFLATPLFVYTGEEDPDVFLLPVDRVSRATAGAGQSILLEDIRAVRLIDSAQPSPSPSQV